MKKLIGLCLSLILIIVSVMPSYASAVGIGEVIGNIYSTDILATINGIPIPSYSIGGKTVIVVEDLRHYGSKVIYDNNVRTLNVNLSFGGTAVQGLPTERGQVGAVVGNIFKTDIITNFRYGPLSGYIAVPSYAIDGKMCVAIEDLGNLIPGISYRWDGTHRIIELLISDPLTHRVNLADVVGRAYDEVGAFLGNVISVGFTHSLEVQYIFESRNILFDTAIVANTSTMSHTVPEFIDYLSIQYAEPENESLASFADREGFSSYEESRRFHFNGLDHTSTYEDVEKVFSSEDFQRTYVRDLAIFGNLSVFGIITNNDVEVEVLVPTGENVLWGLFDNILYWNEYLAITFHFSHDGRVIGFIVFSIRVS